MPPRAPGVGDGFSAVTIGADGTCIANAAATVSDGRSAGGARLRRRRAGRATALEERLGSGDLSEDAVRTGASGLGATLDPPADVHASADYRRHLSETCAVRAVVQAAARAKGAA